MNNFIAELKLLPQIRAANWKLERSHTLATRERETAHADLEEHQFPTGSTEDRSPCVTQLVIIVELNGNTSASNRAFDPERRTRPTTPHTRSQWAKSALQLT
ncbi:hypothetical protein ON010_g3709 [Phytophthora cinnamomi]|nr:hypothetical protein ON010_g3709 [Phytophthora cinnamomi]